MVQSILDIFFGSDKQELLIKSQPSCKLWTESQDAPSRICLVWKCIRTWRGKDGFEIRLAACQVRACMHAASHHELPLFAPSSPFLVRAICHMVSADQSTSINMHNTSIAIVLLPQRCTETNPWLIGHHRSFVALDSNLALHRCQTAAMHMSKPQDTPIQTSSLLPWYIIAALYAIRFTYRDSPALLCMRIALHAHGRPHVVADPLGWQESSQPLLVGITSRGSASRRARNE
jgi:hypothetical protein